MDKRKRLMNVQEALELLNRLSEAESDGGEVSGLSDVSWVCSASDGSSDSDPEPPRNVRPSHPDPPLADGPTCVPLSRHQPKRSGKMAQCGRSWSLAEAQGDGRYRTSSRSLLAQHHMH
ncbi:hypothetical protein JOQ06_030235, partial [Pogonophryne albipinna]